MVMLLSQRLKSIPAICAYIVFIIFMSVTGVKGACANYGYTTIGGTTQTTFGGGIFFGNKVALPTGTLTKMYVHSAVAGGTMQAMLYSEGTGRPKYLLAQSSQVPAMAGWNEINFTPYDIHTAGTYWILFDFSAAGNNPVYDLGVAGESFYLWLGPYPACPPEMFGGTVENKKWPIYAEVCPFPPQIWELAGSVNPVNAAPGETVVYSIDYRYTGNNFTITGSVPPNMTLLSQNAGGTAGCTTPGCSMTWALGNTMEKKAGMVQFTAKINNDVSYGTVVTFTAHASITENPAGIDSNQITLPVDGVTILKSQSQSLANPGDTMTYTLNWGVNGYRLKRFENFDSIAAGAYSNALTLPGWIFQQSGGSTGTWTVLDDGTGNQIVSAAAALDEYPSILMEDGSGTNKSDQFCEGIIASDFMIDPGTDPGADAAIYIRSNGQPAPNTRNYALIASADSNPGYYAIQKCLGTTCYWYAPVTSSALAPKANTWYKTKIFAETSGFDNTIKVKAWERGDPEPAGYVINWVDVNAATNTAFRCDGLGTYNDWRPGLGEQAGAVTGDTKNIYDNYYVYEKRAVVNGKLYDTVPACISYISSDGADSLHSAGSFSGGMVSWDIAGPTSNAFAQRKWTGLITSACSITNVAALNSASFGVPVFSNQVVAGIETATPTFTPTPTAALCPCEKQLGKTDIGASQADISGSIQMNRYTLYTGTNFTADAVWVYVAATNGTAKMRAGLYLAGGMNHNFIAESEEIIPVVGWNRLGITPAANLTSGLQTGIAIRAEASIEIAYDTGANGNIHKVATPAIYGAMPQPVLSTDLNNPLNDRFYSMYVDYCPLDCNITPTMTQTITPSPTSTQTMCAITPLSFVDFPAGGQSYVSVTQASGIASSTCGVVTLVEAAIQRQSDGNYWDFTLGSWTSAVLYWEVVSGTTNWNLTAMPSLNAGETYTVFSRAYDSVGNIEGPGLGNTFSIIAPSPTVTRTPTDTATQTITLTVTQTNTTTVTQTATPTVTQTATPTVTQTATPTVTQTATPTVTQTATPTFIPISVVSLTDVPARLIYPGQVNQLVLQVDIFGGVDILEEIEIREQTSGADEPTEFSGVYLWYQPAGGVFNAGTAVSLGQIPISGGFQWRKTGMAQIVTSGSALYVTVDITASPSAPETIRMSVESGKLKFTGIGNSQPASDLINAFIQTIMSGTLTVTPTVTQTNTSSFTRSVTQTITRTNTQTVTQTITQTVTETITQSATPTVTETPVNTATMTATPSATTTPVCGAQGNQVIGTGVTNPINDAMNASRFWLQAGQITGIALYVSPTTAAGNLQLSIYTDNANTPDARLATSVSQSMSDGWNVLSLNYTIPSDGYYWLAFQHSANGPWFRYGIAGAPANSMMNLSGVTYGTWPGTWVGGTPATALWSLYVINCVQGTQTFTPTITLTFTPTQTPSPTDTATFTETNTPTETWTLTSTLTPTQSSTQTGTATDTPTYTATPTPTQSFTRTSTVTDTSTYTATPTFTWTLTQTPSSTQTGTATQTPTFTMTASPTESWTLTPTLTHTRTWTLTSTLTPTLSWTQTGTVTDTQTATPTYTLTETGTHTFTVTFTPTSTATPTFTGTFTVTPTFTQTSTGTYTSTATGTPTASYTATNTPTSTGTFTATSTYTITQTQTVTATFTSTPTPYENIALNKNYVKPGEGETVNLKVKAEAIGVEIVAKMYNLTGEFVREIKYTTTAIGWNDIAWDVKNEAGRTVGQGLYFVHIKNGNQSVIRKIYVLK